MVAIICDRGDRYLSTGLFRGSWRFDLALTPTLSQREREFCSNVKIPKAEVIEAKETTQSNLSQRLIQKLQIVF
jgi:hypothetical protein